MNKQQHSTNKIFTAIFLVFSILIFSQNNNKKFDSIKEILLRDQFSAPDEAIKLSRSLLDSAKSTKPFFYRMIGTAYWSKGDKDKAIEYLELSKKIADLEGNDKDYVGTIIVSSVVYLNIGLHDKAKADLASGKIKAARIKNRFSRLMDLNSINRIYADICRIEKDYQCAFRLFNQSVLTLKRIKINLENNVERRTVNRNLAINHIKLAEIYTIMKDFKNAKKILRQGSKYAESSEDPRIMSIILSEIAVVNKFEGNYATAIPILQQMLKEPSLNEDIKSNIHKELAENYKHMKNIERENYHNNKYIELAAKDDSIERKAINRSMTNSDNENKFMFNLFQKKVYIIIGIIICIGGFIYTYQKYQISKSRKQYQDVLTKLEEKQNVSIASKQLTKQSINAGKEQELLAQLREFESSIEFLDKNLTLSLLSTKLKTNNTYLSEVINRHYGKNFTTYINELKIYYIINKIETDNRYRNYKISYLAEESGFISHSAFATTFKNITGMPPSEFIRISKNSTKSL